MDSGLSSEPRWANGSDVIGGGFHDPEAKCTSLPV